MTLTRAVISEEKHLKSPVRRNLARRVATEGHPYSSFRVPHTKNVDTKGSDLGLGP